MKWRVGWWLLAGVSCVSALGSCVAADVWGWLVSFPLAVVAIVAGTVVVLHVEEGR